VADKTRRPLYYLQAEELGTNAKSLGEKVKKVFEMATEWNAVILLDGKPTRLRSDSGVTKFKPRGGRLHGKTFARRRRKKRTRIE